MTLTASKLIRVGHSPDPDDAFMFYALAKDKIPMHGFRVEHVIEDIESLNQRAFKAELEVTAVSCHAYAYLADQYAVMRAGSSVGDKYGPILVSKPSPNALVGDPRLKSRGDDRWPDIRGKKVAVPGKFTTAFLAMQLYEKNFEPVFIPFDRILDAVKTGKADVGLVIHEGQITYGQHGLEKIADLGEWWYEKTSGLPLPLGVDVIRRDLGAENIRMFSRLFKESIEFALAHRKEALEYAMQYGRGIQEKDADRFVGMYVNDLTVDLGPRGEEGFRRLLDEGFSAGILPKKINLDFV